MELMTIVFNPDWISAIVAVISLLTVIITAWITINNRVTKMETEFKLKILEIEKRQDEDRERQDEDRKQFSCDLKELNIKLFEKLDKIEIKTDVILILKEKIYQIEKRFDNKNNKQ